MAADGTEGVKKMLVRTKAQLADMTKLVRGKLSKNARTSIGALTVIDVHARDVTIGLIADGVSKKTDFLWLSQMRYYWQEDNLWVQMVAARRAARRHVAPRFEIVVPRPPAAAAAVPAPQRRVAVPELAEAVAPGLVGDAARRVLPLRPLRLSSILAIAGHA